MHRGGVLLRTTTPPPLGAGVHLTLQLPDETELVLVGDVTEIMDAQGVVVRFRVATPIVSQLESRAFREQRGTGRPAPPLARGTFPTADADADARAESEPGTTYSIHKKPRKR